VYLAGISKDVEENFIGPKASVELATNAKQVSYMNIYI